MKPDDKFFAILWGLAAVVIIAVVCGLTWGVVATSRYQQAVNKAAIEAGCSQKQEGTYRLWVCP